MKEKFNFENFSSFTVNGKTRKIDDLKNHLTESYKNRITVNTKLNIGDVVKLKDRPYEVIVENVDYEIDGIGKVDYLGRKTNQEDNKILCFFYQYEIEEIIKRNNKERNEGEER